MLTPKKNHTNNLNTLRPGLWGECGPQKDNSFTRGGITCLFKNLEQELVKLISQADAIVGCVAWLTNPSIITAMQKVRASIIVQKEDFLRPDHGISISDQKWRFALREQYSKIRRLDWHETEYVEGTTDDYSFNYWNHDNYEAVRCVGNHNSSKFPAFPRMHNKFLVFLKKRNIIPQIPQTLWEYEELEEDPDTTYEPVAVWTGSFNFTKNSGNSLENAVIIRDPEIAQQYAKEWYQILGLSEELDWNSEWCEPELRIGT